MLFQHETIIIHSLTRCMSESSSWKSTLKSYKFVINNTHLVVHSSSSLERSLREALCFSSNRSFSLLAVSIKTIRNMNEEPLQTHMRVLWMQPCVRTCIKVKTFMFTCGWCYLCLRFPWLWCRASAGSLSVPVVSPCPVPARLVSWQSWWSYTSTQK